MRWCGLDTAATLGAEPEGLYLLTQFHSPASHDLKGSVAVILACALSFSALTGEAFAEASDVSESQTRRAGVGPEPQDFEYVAFPMVAYTPETSVVLAGAGLLFFTLSDAPGAPRSDAMATGAYTLKGQGVLQLKSTLNLGRGDWQLKPSILLLDWPSDFFGVRSTPSPQPEEFTNQQAETELILNRRIFPSAYLGIAYEASYSSISAPRESRMIASNLPGFEGGFSSGVGVRFDWDRRDTKFAATRGTRVSFESTFFNEGLGGDFNFVKTRVDLRYFMSWSEHTLGFHAVTRMTHGDTPFYDLSTIGGSNQLRGVYSGKYVDQHMAVLQTEYRTPYFLWRFGLAGFGGVGQTFTSPDELALDRLKWGAGGGVRFLLKEAERVNIRLDFGFGEDGMNVYFGLAEAF